MHCMKRSLSILVFCILICGYASLAGAKVYLDIDSPTWQQIAIAVPDFQNSPSGGSAPAGLAGKLSEELSNLLQITAFFRVINKQAYLTRPNTSPEHIAFADWVAIGAEYLVQGSFQRAGDTVTLACSLYDVVKGENVLTRKYAGKVTEGKNMLRKFAGDVLLTLTGEGDIFNTRIAFVMKKGRATDICSITYDGSDLSKIKESKTILMSPRWYPTGRFLAFTSYEDGNPDVYIKDLQKSSDMKVASFPGINLAGGWSPDGKKMLLTLSKDGNEEIYLLDFGAKLLQRLTTDISIDVSPAWSPDGTKIAFVSNRSGEPQIYIMDIDGNNVRRLTWEGSYNTSPAWSPKGDLIAYEGMVDSKFQIFTIDTKGEHVKQLTFNEGSKTPSWSPDGRYIAFSRSIHEKKSISVMTLSGSSTRLLYEGEGDCVSPSWSPRLQ